MNLLRILAVALWAASAFLAFWTIRLLVVTGFLLHLRAGGQGAYIGAVVFPVVAIVLAWTGRRAWLRGGSRDRG